MSTSSQEASLNDIQADKMEAVIKLQFYNRIYPLLLNINCVFVFILPYFLFHFYRYFEQPYQSEYHYLKARKRCVKNSGSLNSLSPASRTVLCKDISPVAFYHCCFRYNIQHYHFYIVTLSLRTFFSFREPIHAANIVSVIQFYRLSNLYNFNSNSNTTPVTTELQVAMCSSSDFSIYFMNRYC